ncbi:hypothetical protein LV84_04140 [Algoriphagus ratkowskyi]|uniref:Uncharacterized protein n=1 Tax=Algoriphagus ratkowskyi TaxID=57028 RepID=A0A2W7QV23_9BACT|nr:hypothetical protein [Algoriphagus ratkowskyi]PZX49950.1 hypothetical protein LV84_04140 [Algoriphagus ratkowskyi]TXD75521.1 hypothetical protein ESW18_20125 [Algoriphagus ratkowskyi]
MEEVKEFENEPLIIPASRILRPQQQYNMIMNRSRMARIKSEMEYAAIYGEVYHLWWHPHNFGACPDSSMAELNEIINQFNRLKMEYGMQSFNMRSLGEQVKNNALIG